MGEVQEGGRSNSGHTPSPITTSTSLMQQQQQNEMAAGQPGPGRPETFNPQWVQETIWSFPLSPASTPPRKAPRVAEGRLLGPTSPHSSAKADTK